MKTSNWIDISYPLSENMHYWPQDPIPPDIRNNHSETEHGTISMTQMTINTHHGTHIDAPRHFFANGATIDTMPLDAIMGPARVIQLKDTESVKADELLPHNIQAGERILLKTVNSGSGYYHQSRFVENFVYISDDAAQFLVEKKISVIGIDYLAVGSFRDRDCLINVHRTFLGNGVWIIEALDLSAVEPGEYEIICLPIRVYQGDAGQARAIIRPL